MQSRRSALKPSCGLLIACVIALASMAVRAAEPVTVAVADFDYADTSGEATDQAAAHAARLRALTQQMRDGLDDSGRYRVMQLACASGPCSAGNTDPAEPIAKARAAGARLLVFGGVQKMSTLIQFASAQVVDLEADRLVFNRRLSFRGDTDEAWRRAGEFLVADLVKENLVP